MSTRSKIFVSVAIVLAFIGAVAGVGALLAPVPAGVIVSPQGVSNFDSIHLSDTGGTATPVFLANQSGTGKILELQDAGTPVYSVNDGGGVSQTGDQTLTGDFSLAGNAIVAGPTVATTATPMASLNTAADAPDLLVISKDATPVVFVHNSGQVEFDGDINADSTSDFAGTSTFSKGSGNAIVVSAGGTISLPHTADINAIGYVAIGNGTPDGSVTAGTDEQLYVEGACEIDGELEADGAIDADSTSDFADTATFSKGSGNAVVISAGGTLSLPHTADINAIGYVAIGNGTPDGSVTAGTDEQMYCEGAFEVDGEAEFDGAIDADSTSDFADTATFSKGSGNAIVISAGGTLSLPHTADINAIGYVAIGNGTPDGSVTAGTDEQLYVEGAMEVDGALDADSTANFAGAVTLQGALYTSFTDLAVSDGQTITPTYTTYALDTTGNVTITLAATGQEGQLLVLINDDANTTIIADTNLASSDGNAITLTGADDIAVFVYQDAVWHELLTITDS